MPSWFSTREIQFDPIGDDLSIERESESESEVERFAFCLSGAELRSLCGSHILSVSLREAQAKVSRTHVTKRKKEDA